MRTKRDFYNEITAITREGLKDLQELSAQKRLTDDEIKSGRYSAEYVKKHLIPKSDSLRREIEAVRTNANKEAQRICDEYIEELRAQDDLDPALLTDDVKLLQAGVNLKPRDISAMLKRNADNHTMTQVILRYCKENDIDTGGVHYLGNKQTINNVSVVPYTVKTTLKWSDKNNMYEKLMGEGSDLDVAFSE